MEAVTAGVIETVGDNVMLPERLPAAVEHQKQPAETDKIPLQATDDEAASEDVKAETTVYFDGSCPLCTAEIGHYASRRGGESLRFVDVSDENAELGPDLTSQTAMRRFHVRMADGTLVSGARAFVVVWRELPSWQWAAWLASLPGATPSLELVYRLFLPIRPALSKFVTWLGAKPANRPTTGL